MTKARTQILFQVQALNATEAAREVPDEQGIEIWDKAKFQSEYQKKNPTIAADEAKQQAAMCWENWFGLRDDADSNPTAQYLSKNAAELMLAHPDLFKQGLDFQHLPLGFIRTNHPQTGLCNVIHYNHFLAERQHVSPLHIPLPEAPGAPAMPELPPLKLPEPDASWYAQLQKYNQLPDGKMYCSESALRTAFLHFYNFLKEQHPPLSFYELPDTCLFKSNACHPILLLARWHTLLSQPHLQPLDKKPQWEGLIHLPLSDGKTAIRVITDHQWTGKPRGFILPSMFPDQKPYTDPAKYKELEALLNKLEEDFNSPTRKEECYLWWQYLALQPKRRSITFYQEMWGKLDTLIHTLTEKGWQWIDSHYMSLVATLLTSTSSNNFNVDLAGESDDTRYWNDFIKLIDEFESVIGAVLGDAQKGSNTKILLEHCERFGRMINSLMLNSTGQYIKNFIETRLSLGYIAWCVAHAQDVFTPLHVISERQNTVLTNYEAAFYQGACAYHKHGQWEPTMSIGDYVALQYALYLHGCAFTSQDPPNPNALSAELPASVVAHLSFFKLEALPMVGDAEFSVQIHPIPEEVIAFHNDIRPYTTPEKLPNLEIFFALLETARAPQTFQKGEVFDLLKLLHGRVADETFVTETLTTHFPKQFFLEDLQNFYKQLLAAKNGLTEAEIGRLCQTELSNEHKKIVQTLLAHVFKNSPTRSASRADDFKKMLTLIQNLHQIISAPDFAELLRILDALPPKVLSVTAFQALLETIERDKSIESLCQIHQCYLNLEEKKSEAKKAPDIRLLEKYKDYAEPLKPTLAALFKQYPRLHQHAFSETAANLQLRLSDSAIIVPGLKYLATFSTKHPLCQHYLLKSFETLGSRSINLLMNYTWLSEQPEEIVFTLLAEYHEKPKSFIELLTAIEAHEETDRTPLLRLITRLINNKQSIKDVSAFLADLKKPEAAAMKTFLTTVLKTPPLPDIPALRKQITKSKEDIETAYQAFSLKPFGERQEAYQFNLAHYKQQRGQFVVHDAQSSFDKTLFKDENGAALEAQLKANRALSIADLKKGLQTNWREKPLSEKCGLLIEFLARTCGQKDPADPEKMISQELNTTQIMALWAMISSKDSKILNQIATGEGKSRIMMVLAAYQALEGKTVDLLTSDLVLAERDYRDYQAFFTALDLHTCLVTLDTQPGLYKKGGIHFSTNDALSLCRHQSDIEGQPHRFLNETEADRCLLIDEVDALIDLDRSSKNFAKENALLAPFTWVYLELMNFIATDPPLENREKAFLAYLDTHHDPFEVAELKSLLEKHPKQGALWLNAAAVARAMVQGVDYEVGDQRIAVSDRKGKTLYVYPIQVVKEGRIIAGSTYRDGVQQCLVAREILAAKAAQKAPHFYIEPESQLIRASYAINMVDKYKNGRVIGVSGTPSLLGKKDKTTNPEGYLCLEVPREKALKRQDLPPILVKDTAQQLDYLKRALAQDKLDKNENPLLLVTRDDVQTAEILAALAADPFFKSYTQTALTAKTPPKEEKKALAAAGTKKQILIGAAGIVGRGTDIKASTPLFTACLFQPATLAEEMQIRGRAGRFGETGYYRQILSQTDNPALRKPTGNVARVVAERQQAEAQLVDKERTIIETVARLQEDLHTLQFKKQTSGPPNWEAWESYLGEFEKEATALEGDLASLPVKDWNTKLQDFSTEWVDKFGSQVNPEVSLQDKEALKGAARKVGEEATKYMDEAPKKHVVPDKSPKVKRYYDIADDGQSCVYDSLFVQTRATLFGNRPFFANTRAWWQGRGELFADTRDSDRPFFANTRAFLSRIIQWLRDIVRSLRGQIPSAPSSEPKMA